jgi:hypothetical protein
MAVNWCSNPDAGVIIPVNYLYREKRFWTNIIVLIVELFFAVLGKDLDDFVEKFIF